MSPEQVVCKAVTPASDPDSFGGLFELVTGRLPFVADAPLAGGLQAPGDVGAL